MPSKSGMSQSLSGVAAVVAVIATFIITPLFFQISAPLVSSYALSQYGSDWQDAAGLLWGIVSVFLVYWVSNLLTQEFLIKRGLNTFIR